MANRNRIQQHDSRETKTQSISPRLLSSDRSQSSEINDDLIVTLSDAYENRRARQVGEWEELYGQNVYRAF